MQGFGPRLRLISALAWAVVALGGSAPAQAQDAFVLEIDGPETTLVTQTIREEIARLGAPPSGRLSVTRAAGIATVTYVAADGRVIERSITIQRDSRESAQEIALLAVSMMRDDGAPPAEPAPSVTEPPASDPPVSEPPPAPRTDAAAVRPPEAVAGGSLTRGSRGGGAIAVDDPCEPSGRSLPVGFDIFPYVGMSSDADMRDSTRGLSLNLVGGLSNSVRGLEVGSLFNIETAGVCGLQIGGAVNIVRGSVRGIEIAGNVNVTGAFEGAQIAGNVNVSRDIIGLQAAGVVNVARGDVVGVQLGTVNVATAQVRGVQIGLVNVADSSDFSLGAININTEGRTHIDVWSELEVGLLFSAVKHGGAHWHYFYGLGTRLTDPNLMAAFGVGGHARFAEWVYLNFDALSYLAPSFRNGDLSTLAQARIVAGFNVIDELAFYAGPSFNALFGPTSDNEWAPDYSYQRERGTGTLVAMWPGATLGMQVLSE